MTTNHKEEVLKVYPDAVCKQNYAGAYVVYKNKTEYINIIAIEWVTPMKAWQNAYNNIKNKI